MSILSGTSAAAGDPLKYEHAAFPSAALTGDLYATNPALAPSLTEQPTGALPDADYAYKFTYAFRDPVTNAVFGETAPSPASSSLPPAANSKIQVSGIAVSTNAYVNSRRIYRQTGGSGPFELVGILLDNITTNFIDNSPTITGQPSVPAINNTGQTLIGNVANPTDTAIELQLAGVSKFKMQADGKSTLGKFNNTINKDFTQKTVDSSSTDEIYTHTFDIGDIGELAGISVKLFGSVVDNNGDTLNLRVKMGGVTCHSGIMSVSANGNTRFWSWEFGFLQATGPSPGPADQRWWSTMIGSLGHASFDFAYLRTGASSFGYTFLGAGYSTSAVDLTGAVTLLVEGNWEVGTGSTTFVKEVAILTLHPTES